MSITITNLAEEFNVSESNLGETISYKFTNNIDTDKMNELLNKYDISVLEKLVIIMEKYKNDMCDTIIERRRKYNETHEDDETNINNDCKNLMHGLNVIKRGINRINLLIEEKNAAIHNNLMHTHLKLFGLCVFVLFIIYISLFYTFSHFKRPFYRAKK